ncbi:MAG: hypothetical protein EOP45_04015 [Sphingobacteriaceae bacterium]|nr:MAG: hypothetical protein EOP45_04015 [Sphingobacteriaceae bacterium]
MAESNNTSFTGNSSSSQPGINPIISADNSSHSITSHKLNGSNFMEWSQSVKLFVQGRGKFGYLSGITTKPDVKEDAAKYGVWEAENSMIMSWLINSMDAGLGRTYLFLPTASDIWTAVRETYSDLGNAGTLFEIETQLSKARQGEKSVTKYYTDLKMLWQEEDLYCNHEWSCPKDSALYQKLVEKGRVFKFLVGLNADLDEVRGRILGRDPLPSTREVFSEVRREETRRQVMLGSGKNEAAPTHSETSAMVSSKPNYNNNNNNNNNRNPRNSSGRYNNNAPTCEYCKKDRAHQSKVLEASRQT